MSEVPAQVRGAKLQRFIVLLVVLGLIGCESVSSSQTGVPFLVPQMWAVLLMTKVPLMVVYRQVIWGSTSMDASQMDQVGQPQGPSVDVCPDFPPTHTAFIDGEG